MRREAAMTKGKFQNNEKMLEGREKQRGVFGVLKEGKIIKEGFRFCNRREGEREGGLDDFI